MLYRATVPLGSERWGAHGVRGHVPKVSALKCLWRCLRLQDIAVAVDSSEYAIAQVELIVGILVGMVKGAAGWTVDMRTE